MSQKSEQNDMNRLKKQNIHETLNLVTNLSTSGYYNSKENKNLIKLKKPLSTGNFGSENSFSNNKVENNFAEIMQITLNTESPVTRKIKVKGNKNKNIKNHSSIQEEKAEFTLRPNFSLAGCQDLAFMKSDSYKLTDNTIEREKLESFNYNSQDIPFKKNLLILNSTELEDKYIQNTDEFRVNTEGNTGNMANLSKSKNDSSNLFTEVTIPIQKSETYKKLENSKKDNSGGILPIITEVLRSESPNLVRNSPIQDRDIVVTEIDEEEGHRILERLQKGMFEEDGNFIIDSAKLRGQNNTDGCKFTGYSKSNSNKIESEYISSVKEDKELNNISISVIGNMNFKTGKFSKYKNLYQKNDAKQRLDLMIASRLKNGQKKTSLSDYSKERIKSSSNSKEKILNKYKNITHIGQGKSNSGMSPSQTSLKKTGISQSSPTVSHASKMTSPKNERSVNLNEKFFNSGNTSKFTVDNKDQNINKNLMRSKSNKIQKFKNSKILGPPSIENNSDKISRGSKSSTSKFSNGINKSKDLLTRDFSKYDVQKLSYEISKEYSMIKIPKEKKFQERMEFYTLKKQIKDKKLEELVNQHKVKIPEDEKQNVFNKLIDDCNRRNEVKKRIELYSEDDQIINTISQNITELDNIRGVSCESNNITSSFRTFSNSINRKVSSREWDEIYRERFEKKEKEKNEKLNLIRINKERIKLQQEEMLVNSIKQTTKKAPREVICNSVNRLYQDGRQNKSKYEEFNFTQTIRKNLEKSIENNFSPIKREEEDSNAFSISLNQQEQPETESIKNYKSPIGLTNFERKSSKQIKTYGITYLTDNSKSKVVENPKYKNRLSNIDRKAKQSSAELKKQINEKKKEIKEFEKLREIEMYKSTKIRDEYMGKIKNDLNSNYKPKQINKNESSKNISSSISKSLKEKSNSSKILMKSKIAKVQNFMKIVNDSNFQIQSNEKDNIDSSQQNLDMNSIQLSKVPIPQHPQHQQVKKNTKKNKFIYKEPSYMKILYGGIEDLTSSRKVKDKFYSNNNNFDKQISPFNNLSSDQRQTCFNYTNEQSGALTRTIQSAEHLISTMNTGNILSSPSSSGGNNINININAPINITSSSGSLNHQNLEHQADALSSSRYVPEYLRKKLVNSIIGGFSK
jgi:hypothetical protein